jgi:hypothetical protein
MGMFQLFNKRDTMPVALLDLLQRPRVDDVVVVDGCGEYKDKVETGRLGRAKGESKKA